jgi:hypothetical protein
MASRPSHYCRWSTKRYVLAALAGTLVVSLVVIAVSIVLTPAEVYFTVTKVTTNSSDNGVKFLNIVLTANNTSHRASVKYRSVIVYLRYKADVAKTIGLREVSPPSSQPPWSTASINVSAALPLKLLMSDFGGRGPNATLVSVLLDTVVLFEYGSVYTRPYNIRVLCDPMDYFSRWIRRSLPISCRDD